MSDWRAAHRKELLEKQRHISQKLAQLRELRALVYKWRRIMRNYRKWFGDIEAGAKSSKWFSVESMIRMGSITVQLNQLIGEFEQIGDSKTMGSGSKSTSSSSLSSDQQQAAAAVSVLTSKAGPLAKMAPWELVWHIDPDTSESVRQGDIVAAVVNVTFNPITALGGMGFAKAIAEESMALIKEHPEEFKSLEKGWKDTNKALDNISRCLDTFDLEYLNQLENSLEGALRKYESAYDGAQGADRMSARLLRQTAAGK
ncbi:hypothetical protein ACFL0D_07010 [Thermoproteota archaeon]